MSVALKGEHYGGSVNEAAAFGTRLDTFLILSFINHGKNNYINILYVKTVTILGENMNIEKIGAYSVKTVNFGKSKTKTAPSNINHKKDNKQKVIFALGALALISMAYVAYTKKKFGSEINILKEQIFNKQSKNIPVYASGTAAVIGATAIALNEDKKQPKTEAADDDLRKSMAKIKQEIENKPIEKFTLKKTDVDKTEEQPEIKSEQLTLEDFKKANGHFYRGNAYIDGNGYTGDILIQRKTNKIEMSYEKGELKKSVFSLKNIRGKYEKSEIRTYNKNEDGTRVTEKFERDFSHRKIEDNALFYETWQKTEVIQVSDSKISIQKLTHFGDYLGTYFKKQKDGSWKGYYENREFNDRTKLFDIVARDTDTNKKLTRREIKKFMA